MQLLQGTIPRLRLQQNQSFGALQQATFGGSSSLDSNGSTACDISRLRHRLGIRSCSREGLLRSAENNRSSSLLHSKAAERAEVSPTFHEFSSFPSVKAGRSSSHICRVLSNDIEAHALGSAIEAHALTQLPVDPSRHHDHVEPDPPKNEEAEGPFHLPLANLRTLLHLWDIDNNKADYYQLLSVADYLERLGLDLYFRQEIKSILDCIFRIWTESNLSKTASLLGDLESVSLAFYLLRSHEYDVEASIFQLYRKVDGSFCKRSQHVATDGDTPSADVVDLLNLLRASDLRFRRDVLLRDAYEFASTTLKSMLDGRLSAKTSAEIRHRLKYPWSINFRMVETRETILNFQLESVTAKFSSGRLSPKVISLMLSIASQLFNHYISVFEREIENLERWTKESGLLEVNIRPPMILLPFELGLAYDMPQAKYAYTRNVWAKAWYLIIVQDDLYEGVNAASIEEILVFMDAFKKFDPSILEKLPLVEQLKPVRVVYKAMYDVTETWAKHSSIWHGRDLLQTLIDTWMVRLEIYLNEKRWLESGYKFTTKQYMEEFGKWSFAVETGAPLAYYSIPGWKPSNAFLETRPDMEAIFALAKTGRLLNDARTYEHEKVFDKGKPEFIHLLMEENPHLTEEDAVEQSFQYAQETLEEFTEAILRSTIPHHQVKQIVLSCFRTSILMYYHVDGLRSGNWLLGKLMDPLPNVPIELAC